MYIYIIYHTVRTYLGRYIYGTMNITSLLFDKSVNLGSHFGSKTTNIWLPRSPKINFYYHLHYQMYVKKLDIMKIRKDR